jgi:hypothetical protein
MNQGREMGRLVYKQPGYEVDGSYHSKEGSKKVKGYKWGAKWNREKQEARGLFWTHCNLCSCT